MSGIFQLGDFKLLSGRKTKYKICVENATDDDIEAWAFMVAQKVGPFETVEGVPTGGERLAEAIAKYAQPRAGKGGSPLHVHLIVDDVLTTGKTMERMLAERSPAVLAGTIGTIVGAVVFARGQCPPWVRAVCTIHPKLWEL